MKRKASIILISILIWGLVVNMAVHVEPVLAWGDDTHYYLTYYLARKVSFGKEDAKTISSASYYIDHDSDTDSFAFPWGDVEAQWRWHSFDGDRERMNNRRSILNTRWRNVTKEEKLKKLVYFGQYLHFVQDYWSHKDYEANEFGHSYDSVWGFDPDSLQAYFDTFDPEFMVCGTINELKELAKNLTMPYNDISFGQVKDIFRQLVGVSNKGWRSKFPFGFFRKPYETVLKDFINILEKDLGEKIESPIPMNFDRDGNIGGGVSPIYLYIKGLYVPEYSIKGKWIKVNFRVGNKGPYSSGIFEIHYGLYDPKNWGWIERYILSEGFLSPGEERERNVVIENTAFSEDQVVCVVVDNPTEDDNWYDNIQFAPIGKPAKTANVLFLFDTTGSMNDDIQAVKSGAASIVNELNTTDIDVYASVATYKDFPSAPYGESDDYPFRVELKFTNDLATVTQTIQSLSVSGGADWEESVYYALINSIDAEILGGWRGIGAKIVIIMGDAPPHDPEPFTGYTLSDVISAALHADAVSIYTVPIGTSPYASFQKISEETNGKIFSASNASKVVEAIKAAINESLTSPSPFWPMFRQNQQHTGVSASIAPKTNNTIWSFQTGLWVVSSPAVADGMVFVGSGDGNIYAINQATGESIWNFTVDSAEDMRVDSSPAVADGMVFVGSNNGKLYALSESTGELFWSFNASGGINSSPLVIDNMVIFGSSKIYALDEFSGEMLWSFGTGGTQLSSPAIADNMVFIGSIDGNVYALNKTNGNLLWSYATGNQIWSSPAVSNGMVFIGSQVGNVYALNGTSGNLIWLYPAGDRVISSPAVTENLVIVGTMNWATIALNKTNGNLVWSSPTGRYMSSSPAISGDMVFIGSEDGKLWTLNITNGQPIWSYEIGSSIRSSPAIADGMLFVGTDNGRIYAFGPPPPPLPSYYNFTLNITATSGGSTTPLVGSYTHRSGSIISIVAYPSTGYVLDHWELDGINVGSTNPTDVTMGTNHTLHAVFKVLMAGDLNGDGIVDVFDLVIVAYSFGSSIGQPLYNPIADITKDDIVDVFDLVIVAFYFGQTDP